MNALYPQIAAADVLVFGTPVYWYGPTALMKAFLDRFVYHNCPENRPQIRGKRAALAVPFEEEESAAAPLLALFERSFRYLEIEPAGVLLAPGVGARGAILEKPECLTAAEELGRRLAAGG